MFNDKLLDLFLEVYTCYLGNRTLVHNSVVGVFLICRISEAQSLHQSSADGLANVLAYAVGQTRSCCLRISAFKPVQVIHDQRVIVTFILGIILFQAVISVHRAAKSSLSFAEIRNKTH